MKIDISKADKAAVLAALYNASRPQGLGFLKAIPGDMSLDQAREALGYGDDLREFSDSKIQGFPRPGYFDYLHGRPLKIDLSKDVFDTWLYDRDNRDALGVLKDAGLDVSEVAE